MPGSIQPHGALLAVVEPSLSVAQVSANSEAFIGVAPEALLGSSLEALLDEVSVSRVRNALRHDSISLQEQSPLRLSLRERAGQAPRHFDAILHRSGGLLIIELEPTTGDPLAIVAAHRSARRAVDQLDRAATVLELCARAALEVRELTGFDRVMVYRFDADWNGEVAAEAKREDLDELLGLHYPASDIPEQARRLYTLSTLRIIADVDYAPAPLAPLDLSFATLRSVSPIHCEYLRNMGVRSSMSISLLRDGRLWGLIACHHYSTRFVPYEIRLAAEFLGRSLSWQVAAKEHADDADARARAQSLLSSVVSAIEPSLDVIEALALHGNALANLLGANGIAVLRKGRARCWGTTPSEPEVKALAAWLDGPEQAASGPSGIFATDRLSERWAPASAYRASASGVLSITLAPGTSILWFRPELPQTVRWGRGPDKGGVPDPAVPRLSPLGSFTQWRQVVQGRSEPWRAWELGVAADVRGALIGNVLRHADERERLVTLLAKSNAELDQFAYVASHDLKAPLRGIANLSQWIEEDLGDSLSGESREHMRLLRGRVDRLEGLINGILDYSRAGKRVALTRVDLKGLLTELIELIAPPASVTIELREPMPVLEAERVPLTQVLMNLISNAVKHGKPDGTRIAIAAADDGAFVRISVADDGPGIAEEFHERIWGIFQTLRGRDEVESTGIGLSIVRKIVEARGGRAWLESQEGHGATFFVLWPKGEHRRLDHDTDRERG